MTWDQSAPCRGADPEAWFPEYNKDGELLARRICYGCPVKTECAKDAIERGEEFGIRAGIWINKDPDWQDNLHKMAGLTPPRKKSDMCRKGLHDMTVPDAWRVYPAGHRKCARCVDEFNASRRAAA